MRKAMLGMTLAATVVLAACGGGNTTNAGNVAVNGQGNGHGDEHGTVHPMGKKALGEGYEAEVGHVESDSKTELVFEVKVLKDGKDVKDAQVKVWLGDKDGKELSPVANGEWMADEGLFDAHTAVPPTGADGLVLWVRVMHGGKDVKASFDIPKD